MLIENHLVYTFTSSTFDYCVKYSLEENRIVDQYYYNHGQSKLAGYVMLSFNYTMDWLEEGRAAEHRQLVNFYHRGTLLYTYNIRSNQQLVTFSGFVTSIDSVYCISNSGMILSKSLYSNN
jgi:hypothetical protein